MLKWIRFIGKFKYELPNDLYNIYIQFIDCDIDSALCDLCLRKDGYNEHRYKDKATVMYDYTYGNNESEAIRYSLDFEELRDNNILTLDILNVDNIKFGTIRVTFENSKGVMFSKEIYLDDISTKQLFTIERKKNSEDTDYKYIFKMKKFTKNG